ncbi:hypothetical protein PG999_001968 [Apiospora kogelbergensis]|uniref:Uncharacterized protein n=1 Tax=Apiospora kogelbergensis TaxID=1337665 RepID=A0AAW0R744_9PEZI
MMNDMTSRVAKRTDCEPGDNSPACEKPVGGALTVPVSIAVAVPVVIALCVLLYLHRKTTRRHKLEDSDDKYKSLDFGADVGGKGTKRKSTLFGGNAEKGLSAPNHTKGLSMDMNLSSPYLLPPRYSAVSGISQLLGQEHSPARRPVPPHCNLHQQRRWIPAFFPEGTDINDRSGSLPLSKNLLASPSSSPRFLNPHRRPRANSTSPMMVPPCLKSPPPYVDMPAMPALTEPAPVARKDMTPNRDSSALPSSDVQRTVVPAGLGIVDPTAQPSPPPTGALPETPRPGRKESKPVVSDVPSDYEDYAHQFQFSVGEDEPDTPEDRGRQASRPNDAAHAPGLNVPQKENKRLSIGVRPLPPDDFLSSEDPEFRANRIRSFYKEYFEDSKEERPPVPALPQAQRAQYVEDYDAGYMGDAAFYDPDSNAFVMPYAEPVTRRAMTPPPSSNRRPMPGGPNMRGPGGPHGSFGPGPRGPPMGRPRAGSTISAGPGRFGPASPRPGSSASARMSPRGPKKPLPPPSALSTLPTPSKLRDDAFLISNPIDFAPPPTFKDQAAGRSQSPLGERRPFALAVPIASPISSSFDDMAALPSPHVLRKSSTFTGLDFAPPKRFKDPEAMSDAGSVRSMGSGISSAANSAIRNGAGRVSRLPGDQVFTTAAMENELKPKWGMRN